MNARFILTYSRNITVLSVRVIASTCILLTHFLIFSSRFSSEYTTPVPQRFRHLEVQFLCIGDGISWTCSSALRHPVLIILPPLHDIIHTIVLHQMQRNMEILSPPDPPTLTLWQCMHALMFWWCAPAMLNSGILPWAGLVTRCIGAQRFANTSFCIIVSCPHNGDRHQPHRVFTPTITRAQHLQLHQHQWHTGSLSWDLFFNQHIQSFFNSSAHIAFFGSSHVTHYASGVCLPFLHVCSRPRQCSHMNTCNLNTTS